MTTQPKANWLRASLPESRSVPYFIPVWLVFAYIVASSVLDWPRAQYLGAFFATAQVGAQVPLWIHGMKLRQWFVAASVLPVIATVLLVLSIRQMMPNT